MNKFCLCIAYFIAISHTVHAQNNGLIINNDIVMPQDSLESEILIFSVNEFLSSAQKNSENKWILPTEVVETQILIDEIQDIRKSEEYKNDSFFKAYLTNIIPIEEQDYIVKISYLGILNDTPILRASFELIAHKTNEKFLISSPLKRNTQNWKTKIIQNHIFHYPYTIDHEKAQTFVNKVIFYDKKLKNNTGEFHYYLGGDETNPLTLFGVDYKSDYNGYDLISRWVSDHNLKSLWVANETRVFGYDIHDLWHNRLRRVISRKEVHRRVDCHIATLHGGIWGIGWDELFPIFHEKFVVGNNVDWLEHKTNYSHFITNEKSKNYTDDFIGALLVKKIEEEKGFDGVWQLLKTKRTKSEKEYFDVLEELTGISKENYNVEVSKLIDAEMENSGT